MSYPLEKSCEIVDALIREVTPVKFVDSKVVRVGLFGEVPSDIRFTVYWKGGLKHSVNLSLVTIGNEEVVALALAAQYARETIIKKSAKIKAKNAKSKV
jgi:hypothetical protein